MDKPFLVNAAGVLFAVMPDGTPRNADDLTRIWRKWAPPVRFDIEEWETHSPSRGGEVPFIDIRDLACVMANGATVGPNQEYRAEIAAAGADETAWSGDFYTVRLPHGSVTVFSDGTPRDMDEVFAIWPTGPYPVNFDIDGWRRYFGSNQKVIDISDIGMKMSDWKYIPPSGREDSLAGLNRRMNAVEARLKTLENALSNK